MRDARAAHRPGGDRRFPRGRSRSADRHRPGLQRARHAALEPARQRHPVGIKSDSSKGGGGSNELRFEDEKGSEQIWLHAQKDEDIVVENDKTELVKHDETIEIGNDRTRRVDPNIRLDRLLDDPDPSVRARALRLAGEAFSLVTGADLALLDLEGPAPAEPVAGPSDAPEDEDVALDPDEHLPWPDRAKVEAWWAREAGRFARGTRHLLGRPIGRESCLRAFEEGFQRQRRAASLELALLQPATPLRAWRARLVRRTRRPARERAP